MCGSYNIRRGKGGVGRGTAEVAALGPALAALEPEVMLGQKVLSGAAQALQQSKLPQRYLGLSDFCVPHRARGLRHSGNARFCCFEV